MINITETAEEIQQNDLLPGITYVEHESADVVRIDYGREESIYLYSTGGVDLAGFVSTKTRKYLRSKGFAL